MIGAFLRRLFAAPEPRSPKLSYEDRRMILEQPAEWDERRERIIQADFHFMWPIEEGVPLRRSEEECPWGDVYLGDTKFERPVLMYNWLYRYRDWIPDMDCYGFEVMESRGLGFLYDWISIDELKTGEPFPDTPELWRAPDDYIAASEELLRLAKSEDPVGITLLRPFTEGRIWVDGDPSEACLALIEDIGTRARICKERGHEVIGLFCEAHFHTLTCMILK